MAFFSPNTDAAGRTPLRVLLVEDSEIDAELIIVELQRGGYEPTWERVDTAPALTLALRDQPWDIITCDWGMPRFSGPAALALLRGQRIDTPVIVVSGQVGEEHAQTALESGARAVVSKQTLGRLCPAIRRHLEPVRPN